MNESGLKIIKARVEQDKYDAAELKIVKADGVNILKDLYVEKELNDGEFLVVSDNVLVSLHRTLRSGEKANLQLITLTGKALTDPVYSKIDLYDNNIVVCIKAESDMISVKNNQSLKTDALKVQEILSDTDAIKSQITESARVTNPANISDLKFICEDPYNEAVVYKIDKENEEYTTTLLGDKVSFVAVDGVNIYLHSNIVTDIVKTEVVGDPMLQEAKIDVSSINEEIEEVKDTPVEEVPEEKEEVPAEETTDEVEEPIEEKPSKKKRKKVVEEEPEEDDDSSAEKSKVDDVEDSDFDEYFEDEDLDNYDKLSEMITKLINEDRDIKNILKEKELVINDLNKELNKANKEVENKSKKVNTLINENRKYIDENRDLELKIKELEEENMKLKDEALKGRNKIDAVISSIDAVLSDYSEETEKKYTKRR